MKYEDLRSKLITAAANRWQNRDFHEHELLTQAVHHMAELNEANARLVFDLRKAQEMRDVQAVTPEKSADISEHWLADVIAMLHYVAGDLSEDNRLMALAAQSLIVSAPRVTPVGE